MTDSSIDFICWECKVKKYATDFMKKKDGKSYYNTCTDCWRKASAEWWVAKEFKICKRCDHKLPIRMFRRDQHGIPYSDCIHCHEITVDARYRQEKGYSDAPTKKVTFVGGADDKPSDSETK